MITVLLFAVTVVAVAQERRDDSGGAASARAAPLPDPDARLPHDPAALAGTLAATTRRLREAIARWDPDASVPQDVTYLALHHQRTLRLMATRRALGDATLRRLPRNVRGEARDTVLAQRHIARIPRNPKDLPRVRVAAAAPAAELRRHYRTAQRRFGVHWSVLASVNFIESAFGKVRSASEAGARGPMQFLPSTWRQYGMGGDIDDPHDAILGAANLLRAAGARHDLDAALFAYNHSTSYVRAVRRYAVRMRRDERAFRAYYAWQVYVRTATGVRRLTGPR